ncbi:MAG: hypothetical protein V3U16_02815 [Candidatus Neomarinimicrobiota bacterium]
MKNKLLFWGLLTITIFIGCSLSNVDEGDFATWSVKIETPLLRTAFTTDEMFDDNDQINPEPYGDSGELIYTFSEITPIDFPIDTFTVTVDGGIVEPFPVEIDPITEEVETIPEEFEGINFVVIEMFLEPDLSEFNTELADSVILNLTITATNEDEWEESTEVTDQNIINGEYIYIDDAERLINIRPTEIVAEGRLKVYPSGEEGDFIAQSSILVNLHINAPLDLEITDEATFEISPEKVDQMETNGQIESIRLFADVDNQMEFGALILVLAAEDTLSFEEGSSIVPDTITSLTLEPDRKQLITIDLQPEQFNIFFENSVYVKGNLNLMGNVDAMGDPTSSKFLSNDSLKLLIYGSIQVLIDEDESSDGEG